ncbi:MAG: hypothetical protein OXI24_15050 [Candidatus Poribacteria bacterium]|nr:hypothetical protein [Candidatus Poribacteria bacterium]
MGIPFFVVFVLSIAFLSLGITGWGDFVSVEWDKQNSSDVTSDPAVVAPYLSFQSDYWAIARCFIGFLLFLVSLYFMGFFLYLEERESGRIMKNVKSFAKLRRFLERHQKGDLS